MHGKRRLIAFLAVLGMTAGVFYGSQGELTAPVSAGEQNRSETEEAGEGSLFEGGKTGKKTLYFWYSDAALTDFIHSAAVAFGEENNVVVLPQLVSGSEYLEAINEASLYSPQTPDAYLISNDSLGKAYLAGLADEIQDVAQVCDDEHFPQSALAAVTYQGRKVAYPFFFETSILLYNQTYLEEWAGQQARRALAEASEDGPEESAGPEGGGILDEEELAAQTAEYMRAAVPKTVEDILEVADTFDVPEGVEGVMKWDVSDIFYNSWFVGNYMVVGGDPGDDTGNIHINNPEAVRCLEVYQSLNQFFSMDAEGSGTGTVTYDSVIQDFLDGKMVFTIATTDVLAKLAQAEQEEGFAYEYGVAPLPDVSRELRSRSLSVTSAIAVNGYSDQKELANRFAAYLAQDCAPNLYERTGKMPANLAVYKIEEGLSMKAAAMQTFLEEYAKGVPLPKMLETSNYWIQLEILFSKVWNGEDVASLVQELSDQILSQVGT